MARLTPPDLDRIDPAAPTDARSSVGERDAGGVDGGLAALERVTANMTWYDLEVEDVRSALSAPEDGLSTAEAEARLDHFGANELAPAPRDPWYVLVGRQFRSPMILFLCVAALFTAVQQEWFEVLVICLVMVLNASIGLWQTVKAERDVRSLARLTTPVAEVVREGRPRRISAVELVPGDTVLLESGDRIPADLRILHSASLRVDESMLTGEVLPVSKNTDPVPEDSGPGDRTSMAYSGTLVVSGRGRGVVVSTGEDTELGEIAALVQQDSGKTPLQILTDRLERNIGLALLVIATAVFLSGVLMGDPLGESFRTTVALVVSAMPEALPIVLSVAMGVGVSRMAARNAVVRNLPSVETLGSTQVIGSDKTGTLTMNRMTVQSVWTPGGGIRDLGIAAQDSEVGRPAPADEDTAVALSLRTGALTNEAAPHGEEETLLGDAVDVAMAEAALRAGVVDPAERADRPLRDMPYESENAYSQTVREQDGRLVLHVKGAPETVAGFCTRMLAGIEETDLDFRAVLEANDVMAADGLRVIATAHAVLDELPEMFPDPEGGADVARLPEPHDLVLTGLQGMMDPPRPGVKEAIAQCRGAGIHVLMITGDHPVTARAIARRLGLPDTSEPLTGRQLRDLDDAQLRERLRATAVAARMSPQDKLRIVERLKEDGQTVAVTGDGVNDAPALRAASIGVAMGESGTEVAREASDMVLADDNFVTIVDAVRLGRVTFSSIRKATFFLLSNGLAATIAVAVNTFTELPLIFLPVMLLFTNVVTNGIQDVALSFEKGEGDELEQEPRSPKEGVLSTRMWMRTLITGVWMGLGTLLVYRMAHEAGLTLEECRTLAVITMVMFNFFQVFSARAERRSVFRMNPLGNPLLVVSALMALLLQWTATVWAPAADLIGLAPLTASQWLMCTLVGSSVLLIVELEKLVRRVVGRRAQRAEAAELPETAEAAE